MMSVYSMDHFSIIFPSFGYIISAFSHLSDPSCHSNCGHATHKRPKNLMGLNAIRKQWSKPVLMVVQAQPKTLLSLWSAVVPKFRSFSTHVTNQTSYVVVNTILRQGDGQEGCHCFFVLSTFQLLNTLNISYHRGRRRRSWTPVSSKPA